MRQLTKWLGWSLVFNLILFSIVLILLGGCTRLNVKVSAPDGSVVSGTYTVVLQNRTLEYDPQTGLFKSSVNNEPAYVVADIIAKGAMVP